MVGSPGSEIFVIAFIDATVEKFQKHTKYLLPESLRPQWKRTNEGFATRGNGYNGGGGGGGGV